MDEGITTRRIRPGSEWRIFRTCHAREWHIDKFPPFFPCCSVELSEDGIYRLRTTRKRCLLVSACCLLSVIENAYF